MQQKLDPGSVIFISSAYTLGRVTQNVRVQHDMFDALLTLGYTPIAPLFTHYHDIIHPVEYERIMQWCLIMVSRSDALIRIPGESDGADREVSRAHGYGIPVIQTLDEAADAFSPAKSAPNEAKEDYYDAMVTISRLFPLERQS